MSDDETKLSARIGNAVFWGVGGAVAVALLLGWGALGEGSRAQYLIWFLLVWGGLGRLGGMARVAEKMRAIELRALHESGSGILTHAGLMAALEREMGLAKRRGSGLSVVAIEGRNIIAINRDFDRTEGDGALAAIALASQTCLRDTDFLGRAAGLVFCAVLPDTDQSTSQVAINRMRESLRSILRSHPKGEVRVDCAVMGATWDGAESAGALLERVQGALNGV